MNSLPTKDAIRDCPFCAGVLELTTEPTAVPVGKRVVEILHTHLKCNNCGETLLEPSDIDELQIEAATKVRQELGLLVPAAIRAIRKDLALSQEVLEQVLSAAPKSVTRWERGIVCQSGAADSILRVFAKSPETVAILALERGLEIPASPKIKFAYSRYLASAVSPEASRFDMALTVAKVESDQTGDNCYTPFDERLVKVAGR